MTDKSRVPLPAHPSFPPSRGVALQREHHRGADRPAQGKTPDELGPYPPPPRRTSSGTFIPVSWRLTVTGRSRPARSSPTPPPQGCPTSVLACESGKYNAIILLGGGEPGFAEAREIARSYGVVVTANAFSQLHLATMLGNKFTVLDVTGAHNMYYRDVIIGHQLQHRCASIRNIGFHLPRPDQEDLPQLGTEREKARAGEPTQAAKNAVEQAHLAILEDGAEVITLGCSGVFWLQPFIKKGSRREAGTCLCSRATALRSSWRKSCSTWGSTPAGSPTCQTARGCCR